MATSAFEINRGNSFTIEVNLTDEDGNSLVLTGSKIYFTAKKNLGDPDSDAVLMKSVDAEEGNTSVEISFTAEETRSLKPRNYWWDVQVINGDEVTSTDRRLFKVLQPVKLQVTEDAS